jgi:hypothetical protein
MAYEAYVAELSKLGEMYAGLTPQETPKWPLRSMPLLRPCVTLFATQ